MRKFTVGCLAVVGTIAILFFLLVLVIGFAASSYKGRVPSSAVLEVNLESGVIEDIPDDAVARAMLGNQPSMRDIVDAIERASTDDRVKGLFARFGGSSMGLAKAQEIREAVSNFRAHKKFAVAWSETFGEFGPGGASYYIASAFDQVWMQPSGDVGLTGVILEGEFLRGTLDKLNVVPRMDHRYEYKAAMNQFTERKFTDAHREEMEAVMHSWSSQLAKGIGEGRKLTPDEVRAVVDRGPLLGKEAVDAKLVDGLAYHEEIYTKVKQMAGAGSELIYLNKYLERAGRPHKSGKTIALIYGVGAVGRGKSGFDPLFGSASMGSDTVTAAFRDAVKDPRVKAILFRVDSPGGSYVASDAIWEETVRARKAGKPVIVSMGDLAGSGGYFVAMAADKIVAQPATITGSIGVLGGKMLTTGFWKMLGITFDEVHDGANATYWTGTEDYTPAEWARFEAWLDRVYVDFTSKVADGRRLSKERVLEIAKGRIWSGEDGKALGLVDELGGFPEALALAKKAAKIPAGEEVSLQLFPRKKTTWQTFMDALSGETPESSEQDAEATAMIRALRMVQPLARQVRAATGQTGVLEMPAVQGRP
ncbi:MAG TPA: signal peptide peptidase SppA [Bryobacteraceae bacterium]|nr:signal peptide peptidase SppA [Bryobacteraceae bacterium]